MSAPPLVSVVIPAWNAGRSIAGGVAAALGQEGVGGSIEVIVVDDGSTDETGEAAGGAGARVVRQENGGPAAARNRGWREAAGEWVFFTDSDCVPRPDWVARLLPALREKNVGAAGGTYDAANPDSFLAACVQEEIALRHLRMPREVRFLGSFNLAVPRRVLEETGGFDEEYRRASGEDNDLSYRIRKRGYRLIFDREARVAHRHPEKIGRYLKEQTRHGYWRMKLYREHPERMGGDDYSGAADFIEPPAAALFLLLLPLSRLPVVGSALLALFLLLFAAALTPTVVMVRRGGGRFAGFLPVKMARAFARGAGMAVGIVRFWIVPLRRGGRREGRGGRNGDSRSRIQ
ncbi:MAG: glycosyltransferase [Candidatus Eisenbacteria bacterium]